MTVICPKCSHVRPSTATNPSWECPACGVCYAKFNGGAPAPARRERDVPVAVRQGWPLATPLKILLLVAVGWGIHLAYERHGKANVDDVAVVKQEEEHEHEQARSKKIVAADAIVGASGIDATALRDISAGLERGCARNNRGLSERECVALVRERSDTCATSTARRFPGQIGDTRRMEIVVRAHVGCIFDA